MEPPEGDGAPRASASAIAPAPSDKASVIFSAMVEKASSNIPMNIIEWFTIRFSSFSSLADAGRRLTMAGELPSERKWVLVSGARTDGLL